MPNGKFTPCCAWHGQHFDSPQDIIDYLGPIFKKNQAPETCQGACRPIDANNSDPGWRGIYKDYATDFENLQIQFLDFRNSNLCNMKCRSCGPIFSSSWAQEVGHRVVLKQDLIDFTKLDLSQCKKIYFAGGESLLNYQHYELLEYLIERGQNPVLQYSTNLSVLKYKNTHVGDLWKHFSAIRVHGSIDAVGKYAEFVRSGTDWNEIQNNIKWIMDQPNITLNFGPVISAINIWWIDKLFEFIEQTVELPEQFQPVLANGGDEDISVIPRQWRQPLIDHLEICKFKHHNIDQAIDILETVDDSARWPKFLLKQLSTDLVRNEAWFNNLPIRDEVYRSIYQFYE